MQADARVSLPSLLSVQKIFLCIILNFKIFIVREKYYRFSPSFLGQNIGFCMTSSSLLMIYDSSYIYICVHIYIHKFYSVSLAFHTQSSYIPLLFSIVYFFYIHTCNNNDDEYFSVELRNKKKSQRRSQVFHSFSSIRLVSVFKPYKKQNI